MVNNVCKGLTIYYGALARRAEQLLGEAPAAAVPAAAPQTHQQPGKPHAHGEEQQEAQEQPVMAPPQQQEQEEVLEHLLDEGHTPQAADGAGSGKAQGAASNGRKSVCRQQ